MEEIMLDTILVGLILCIITAVGVILFRKTRQSNPKMVFAIVGCIMILEILICLIADR